MPKMHDSRLNYVPVACGKCFECRKKKARDGYGYTAINPATMNRMALSMSDVDVIYNNTVITSIQVPMQTEAP